MRNRSKALALSAIGLSTALALAGCGSSSDETDATVTSQSETSTPEPDADDVQTPTDSTPDVESEATPNTPEPSESQSEGSGELEVNKGLLSVEVTLPAELISLGEDTPPTEEDLKEAIAEEGSDVEVTLNDDGSATYRMSRGEYNRVLEDIRNSTGEYIQEVIDESPGVFESVTFSDDIRDFEMVVDRQAFESNMGVQFVYIGLAFQGIFYQAFADIPVGDQYVVVRTIDSSTGEEFYTYDSREEQ